MNSVYKLGDLVNREVRSRVRELITFPDRQRWILRNNPEYASPPKFFSAKSADKVVTAGDPSVNVRHSVVSKAEAKPKPDPVQKLPPRPRAGPTNRWFGDGKSFFR